MSDLLLARLLKARILTARLDRLLLAAKDGLIHGGRPRERGSLEQLGLLLRDYRASRAVSRVTMARELGLSVGTLKNMERGRHWPSRTNVDQLARLGVLPAELLAVLQQQRPKR